VDKRNRLTRKLRWEQLDEDLEYKPTQLDRVVVAKDQIRTIIKTFRDKLFTEIFPGRTEIPKTLIFAKDDSHAEDQQTSSLQSIKSQSERPETYQILSIM
jgi:type I restriction enzyme, R subunit